MNFDPDRNTSSRLERFSLPATAAVYGLPLLAAGGCYPLFGPAGPLAVLGLTAWSECLLRIATPLFQGNRKKDKVMVPTVEKTFTAHQPDPILGWALRPDHTARESFSIPRKNLRLDYSVTTNSRGCRITPEGNADAPLVSIHGCSNTFGWGLDDQKTYPWLLAQSLPDARVRNYGVAGYSLYQMLLRMEQTIPQDKPKIVVLGFSPGLEARSINDFHYLRMLSEYGGTPPACISRMGRNRKRKLLRDRLEAYKRLPGADRLLLAGLAERGLNRLRFLRRADQSLKRATTEHLLVAMRELCHRHKATFVVQYLTHDPRYQQFLSRTGILWRPGPVDMDECTPDGRYLFRLYPFDGHPNAEANQRYADSLGQTLREILDTGSLSRTSVPMPSGRRDRTTESAIYPLF